MNRVKTLPFILALLVPLCALGEEKELRVYHASILRTGPNAAKVSAEERSKLFQQHFAYRRSLYLAGDLLMYGPVEDGPDPTLRGFSIFRGDKPIDEIRKLVDADPFVKAGVMSGDVFVWLSEVPRLEKGFTIRRVDVPSN